MPRIHAHSFVGRYSLPDRTQRPATDDETARLSEKQTESEIDKFCKEYMVRLYDSAILLKDAEGHVKTATGATKRVMGALCAFMRQAQCGCFTAPIQAIAGEANVDRKTAAKALRLLENDAYVLRHPARPDDTDGDDNNRYSLVMNRLPVARTNVKDMRDVTDLESIATGSLFHLTTHRLPVPENETPDEMYEREAADRRNNPFHSRNLGPNCTAIYAKLCLKEGQTRSELSKSCGLTKTAISNNVKKLVAQNMVVENEKRQLFTSASRIRTDEDTEMIVRQCARDRAARKAALEVEKANHIAELKAAHPDTWRTILDAEIDAKEAERRTKNERQRQRVTDKIRERAEAQQRGRMAARQAHQGERERLDMAPANAKVRVKRASVSPVTGDAEGGCGLIVA